MATRIDYVSSSTLPSPAANSVHVVHMCQAFAAVGCDVVLHAFRGPAAGLDRYLEGSAFFRINFIGGFARLTRFRKVQEKLWLLGNRFAQRQDTIYYGRNQRLLFRIAQRGARVCLELHYAPGSR